MGLLVVGVQGHQKTLENSKTLMKIDVFVGLVVQVHGCRGGLFYLDLLGSTQGLAACPIESTPLCN